MKIKSKVRGGPRGCGGGGPVSPDVAIPLRSTVHGHPLKGVVCPLSTDAALRRYDERERAMISPFRAFLRRTACPACSARPADERGCPKPGQVFGRAELD